MSNFDTVVLDGEMGLFTKVREGDLPYYTGATEVTPSDETQTLPTADTIVTSNITVNPIPEMDLEEVEVTYTPDEEGQTDTITPSTGYVGIAEVEVTVEPIDPEYVGSDIPRLDSEDLTVSGASVTVPAGFYESGASASVPGGTEGTPVATKGSVSNHSIAVTPSVTNSAGYIAGGTKTGTAVTVSASELVSGTKSITANGTNIDVTEYAAVDVAVPGDTPTLQTKSVSYTPTESAQSATVTADQGYDGLDEVNISVGAIDSEYVGSDVPRKSSSDLSASGATVTAPAGYYESAATKSVASGTAGTPSATKGAVSNHSVSVTPSVTNTAGYISGGTISGTAVTVDVAELESGTKTITENGTGISVSGYSEVDVNVSGGGGGWSADQIAGSAISGDITLDTATTIRQYAFYQCSQITSATIKQVSTTYASAFQGCSNLEVVDYVPKANGLFSRQNIFADCVKLNTIIIRSTNCITCSYSNAINNTPFGSGGSGGTIYIPKVLYDALGTGTNDYKAATTWSTIDGYGTITWAAIEGSYYETHYADGTLIPT